MSEIGIVRTISRLEESLLRIMTVDPQKRTTAPLMSLPQLRATWTMGQVDYQNPQALDISGGGYHLTNNNVALFGDDLSAPYADFDGVNQYLSRADGGAGNWADITGTEAYIPAAQQGLTLGGWFYFDRITNNETLIAKSDATVAGTAYMLQFRGDLANDPIRFIVGSGVAAFTVELQITPTTGRWYFIAGRYDPGTEITLYIGSGGALVTNTNVVGIPAALVDNGTQFTIGANAVPGNYLDGKASCCFLCAGFLSDAWVGCLYSQLRSIFRV